MRRAALAGAVLLGLTGCAAVPPAVVWTTVGAGLGFGGAALKFDDDVFNYLTGRPKPIAVPIDE